LRHDAPGDWRHTANEALRAARQMRRQKENMVMADRVGSMKPIALGVAAAIVISTPVALAQASVKGLFEKYHLLGTFATDCSKSASDDNYYYTNRLLSDGAVQRDRMSGPTKRDIVVFFNQATEVAPNQISVSGTRDGKPTDSIWRVEGTRMLIVESSWDGKKQIEGGKVVANGRDWPWLNRCGG
jgi:hypothetical protein